jgi:hypothetical protein
MTGNELKESRSRSSFCVFLNQTEEKRGTQLALKKPHTKTKTRLKPKKNLKGNKTRKEEGTDRSRPNSQNGI